MGRAPSRSPGADYARQRRISSSRASGSMGLWTKPAQPWDWAHSRVRIVPVTTTSGRAASAGTCRSWRMKCQPSVAVHLARRLVAAQPVDAVLHLDPPPGERRVVAPVLRRPLPAARLAPRRRPVQPRAEPVQPDVAQVPQRPDPGPDQLAGQPRALEHLQVGPPPRPAGGHVHDAAVLVHGHLALERVRLLLA